MKCNSKKVITIILMICLIIVISGESFAHSGRTDSNGGHKDNQNKSGLGSYHYHCGGYPAHLHNNGRCPYSSNSKSTTSTSSKSSSSKSVTTSSSIEDISESIIKTTSVDINENITSMKVGETKMLTASIIPENTEDKTIKWSSNNEDIATVSSTGKVVALKVGTVNITVTTSNGKKDSIVLTVEEVREIEEKSTVVASIQSNELSNTEDSNTVMGVLGLGILGGGSYWGYKKYKKSKK